MRGPDVPRVNVTFTDEDFAALGLIAEGIAGGNRSAAIRKLIGAELEKARRLLALRGGADPDQPSLFVGAGSGAARGTETGPGDEGEA